jgi:hypothetical protein
MQITPSALHEIGSDIKDLMGGAWSLVDLGDVDRTSHFHGPDGRHFAMKMLHDGSTVQMWITGYPAQELPDDADDATQAAHAQYLARRLDEGAHYNARVYLTRLPGDADLPKLLLGKLDHDLFPAWEHKPRRVGQRPWEQPAPKPAADTEPESDTTPESEAAPHSEADTPADAEAQTAEPAPPAARESPAKARRPRKSTSAAEPRPAAKRTRKATAAPAPAEPKARAPRKAAATRPAGMGRAAATTHDLPAEARRHRLHPP